MPTGHTQVTIYNLALDIVNTRPVASTSELSPECRWLNRNYEHYVRVALRTELWNFAKELHELNQQVATPANYLWTYGFDLPVDWLRVIPPRYNGARTGSLIKYEVAGNTLFANHEIVRTGIIVDKQNPGEWDSLFAEYVAARLAHGLAHTLTHKASFKAETKQVLQEAYDVAASVNAFESPVDDTETHDVIRVRSQSW
jgi:hypothetical protein